MGGGGDGGAGVLGEQIQSGHKCMVQSIEALMNSTAGSFSTVAQMFFEETMSLRHELQQTTEALRVLQEHVGAVPRPNGREININEIPLEPRNNNVVRSPSGRIIESPGSPTSLRKE